MKNKILLSIIFSFAAIFTYSENSIMAARQPDTVYKIFVIEGDLAIEFANCFGISFQEETTLHFPAYGRSSITADENYGGASKNSITFTQKNGKPRIILGNEWSDSETGSCKPVPKFWFGSPFIDPELNLENGWTVLLRHLKVSLPLFKSHAKIVEHIRIGADKSPLLDILIYLIYDYTMEQWAYGAQIGIDERNPKERKEAMKRYEEYMNRRYN
jgi:hypothetical protein